MSAVNPEGGVLDPEASVFVAGGAGMAGTAIVDALLRLRPHGRVRATCRDTRPAIDDPRVEYVRVDLAHADSVADQLRGCDAAVFAAAEGGGIRMQHEQPGGQVTPNLIMAATWFEAVRRHRLRRLVMVGSATCYQPRQGAIAESDLDLNIDPSPEVFGIGWVSRTTEKLCEFWARAASIPVVRLRTANIFGPRARFDLARANFIPALIRRAVDGAEPFEVWGSPDVTRDVIFAWDFGEAVVRLLEVPGVEGDVYNLGSGRGVRVGDVVSSVLRAAGREAARIVYTQPVIAATSSRVLNCERLFRVIQWAPRTPLDDAIHTTMRWWINNRTTWVR